MRPSPITSRLLRQSRSVCAPSLALVLTLALFAFLWPSNATRAAAAVGTTSPITTAVATTFAGAPYTFNTWSNARGIFVSLSATAAAGGFAVATTYYSLDNSACTATTLNQCFIYTGPIDIRGPIQHTVIYFSADVAGNVEQPHSVGVWLDYALPVLAVPAAGITVNSTSPAGAVVTYSVTATDPTFTSDQLSIGCTPPSGSVFPIGTTLVICSASDPAGNVGYGSFSVIVLGGDVTPPTTTASATTSNGAYAFGTWTNQSLQMTLSATDNPGGSGVAVTYYALDNAACSPSALSACLSYAGPVTISAEGKHTLTYFSVDKAGNAETPRSQYVWIDTTPPTLNVAGAANGTVFNVCDPAPTRPTFAPTDALSGINSATVSDSWTNNLQPSGVGTYSYSAQASDNAGNISAETRTYSVQYGAAFGGFLTRNPPSGAFKLGSAVNVKFQLQCGSIPISSAVVYLYVQPGSTSAPHAGTAGMPFSYVFSSTLNAYQYVDTLSTGKAYTNPDGSVVNFTAGVWTLTALFDDGATQSQTITLQ